MYFNYLLILQLFVAPMVAPRGFIICCAIEGVGTWKPFLARSKRHPSEVIMKVIFLSLHTPDVEIEVTTNPWTNPQNMRGSHCRKSDLSEVMPFGGVALLKVCGLQK